MWEFRLLDNEMHVWRSFNRYEIEVRKDATAPKWSAEKNPLRDVHPASQNRERTTWHVSTASDTVTNRTINK